MLSNCIHAGGSYTLVLASFDYFSESQCMPMPVSVCMGVDVCI